MISESLTSVVAHVSVSLIGHQHQLELIIPIIDPIKEMRFCSFVIIWKKPSTDMPRAQAMTPVIKLR
jgi:hypothetical protein